MQSQITIAGVEVKNDKRERARRLLVNLVFVIYWLMIFDGALRKWIVPSLDTLIYFIKDPFILAVYWVAIENRLWPRSSVITLCALSLGGIFALLALLQVFVLHAPPLVVLFGLRNYFWCMPLAFLIGSNFRGEDLARFIRQTLLISVPIAVLVYFQFRSPPTHWINTYVGGIEEPAMVGSVVRTCGTFAYISGQTSFVASLFPMLMALWLLPSRHRPMGLISGILASIAVLVNFALNGSRGILVAASMALMTAVGYVALNPGPPIHQRLARVLTSILVPCIVTGVLAVQVFPTAFETQLQRFIERDAAESSILQRGLGTISNLFITLPSAPILGNGLGLGTSGGAAILGGERSMRLAENELPRIVLESGLSGFLYIAFRDILALWLILGAMRATRLSKNPFPVLIVPGIAVGLASGQMTMGGVLMYGSWIFVGISLAANRLGQRALES